MPHLLIDADSICLVDCLSCCSGILAAAAMANCSQLLYLLLALFLTTTVDCCLLSPLLCCWRPCVVEAGVGRDVKFVADPRVAGNVPLPPITLLNKNFMASCFVTVSTPLMEGQPRFCDGMGKRIWMMLVGQNHCEKDSGWSTQRKVMGCLQINFFFCQCAVWWWLMHDWCVDIVTMHGTGALLALSTWQQYSQSIIWMGRCCWIDQHVCSVVLGTQSPWLILPIGSLSFWNPKC